MRGVRGVAACARAHPSAACLESVRAWPWAGAAPCLFCEDGGRRGDAARPALQELEGVNHVADRAGRSIDAAQAA